MTDIFEKIGNPENLRICVYARGKVGLADSKQLWEDYLKQLRELHDGWINCGIYADSVLDGDGMTKMLEDCRQGKIDIILTNSVSRFARNGTRMAEIMRELQSLNVGVYFMSEKLYSKDEIGRKAFRLFFGI